MSAAETAFYCVCDERYFLGAVGMVNSLRLLGHEDPVYVLDCGLTPAQRDLLAAHVILVEGPSDVPPYMLKTIAPRKHPSPVTVLIDTDVIVTRPLTDLISAAAGGQVVGFQNNTDRFFAEWGTLLDLGTARKRPYVSVSLVLLGGTQGEEVLRLMDDRQPRVDFDQTLYGRNAPGYPFIYPEQDVLNAIISTRIEPGSLLAIDERFEAIPPFDGLEAVDPETLRCVFDDGAEPYFLHHFMDRKPWLHATEPGIYSRLLGPAPGLRRRAGEGSRAGDPAPPANRMASRAGPQAGPGPAALSLVHRRSAVGPPSRPGGRAPGDDRRLRWTGLAPPSMRVEPDLLPGRRGARQLAAADRSHRADLRARSWAQPRPTRFPLRGDDAGVRPGGDDAVPAQDRGAASSSGRGHGAARRRHHRHATAERADRCRRGRSGTGRRDEHDRFSRNGGAAGLRPSKRRRYVSSSLVLAGGVVGRRLIELMHDAQPRIEIERTPNAAPNPDWPP